MPGGFHPFHAGHAALYNSAQRAFPDAEVFVAATNDTSSRPFPFAVKEKLAKLAGVQPGYFVQVKSPFRAEEITSQFDPETDHLIFVRSEKDADKQPLAGGVKKNGEPAYLQPLLGAKQLEPFSKHAYMAYLPTVEFGPGMTSATEIRTAWPDLTDKRKTALVMSLYPATQKNPKLAANVVQMLDTAINGELTEGVDTDAKVYRSPTGKFVAWVYIGRKRIEQEGNTKEEALQNLINHVEGMLSARRNASGKYTVVGFNGPFVSGVLRMAGQKFFAKFNDGKLLISTEPKAGFRLVSDGVPSPVGKFSRDDIQNAGLTISSRYDIIPLGTNNSGVLVFDLKHHSDVVDANDRLTRNTPSLTIQMAGRNMEESKVINPRMIDVFYRPVQDSRGRRVVARNIPYTVLDRLLAKLSTKFDVSVDSFEWQEADSIDEMDAQNFVGGMTASYQARDNQPVAEDYVPEKRQ